MHTMREFSRRLSHFKKLAESGKTVRIRDRQGKRFTFKADKPQCIVGSAKDLKSPGPLTDKPFDREEFKPSSY
jgi:hypothetical protein